MYGPLKKISSFMRTVLILLCATGMTQSMEQHGKRDLIPINMTKANAFIQKFMDPNFIFVYTSEIYPTISGTNMQSNKSVNIELVQRAIEQSAGIPPKTIFQFGKVKDPNNPDRDIGYKYVANIVVNHQNNELISKDPRRVEILEKLISQTRIYKSPEGFSSEGKHPEILQTEISDIITVASNWHQSGNKVGVVIAADTHNLGGGHTDGASAMEESIMYSMPYLSPLLGAVVMGEGGLNNKYSIPELGAICVDGAIVMRLSSFQEYKLMSTDRQFPMTTVFSAAPDMRFIADTVRKEKEAEIKASEGYKAQQSDKQMGYFWSKVNEMASERLENYKKEHPEYLKSIEDKVKTQLLAADDAGCDVLLYPAWGMGVFGNKTQDIVNVIKNTVQQFAGKSLKTVQFVVLDMDKGKFLNDINSTLTSKKK